MRQNDQQIKASKLVVCSFYLKNETIVNVVMKEKEFNTFLKYF